MNLYDIVSPLTVEEAKATSQRLDPKCWKGYKKQGTKVKGGVRVNNCVPKESVEEDSWHAGDNAWSSENHEMVEGHSFSNGDQVELKPEYADRAGEVYTVSQCDAERGRCWIGDEDGRGWYARFDQLIPSVGQEELDEFAPGQDRDEDEVPDQILKLANRWWNATDDQPRITNVLRSLGWSIAQVESEDDAVQMQHDDGTTYFISADDFDPDVFEGYQDFNKVEPYAVCLAGKPVKQFDYYEQARRFHDNWKQKLYREGDKAKADTITLMPLNLDEAGSPAQQAAIAIAKKKEQGVEEAIVASGPSKPLDDRAVRKLVWDTMKINADTGEQAIERALSVLAKKPQSRMVLDLQDKFQSLADRLAQGVAEMDKSQKGAPGWNIDDYDYNKGKWTQGTPVTAKDAVKDMNKELNRAFDRNAEPQPTGVKKKNEFDIKESYWAKLQNERNTKLNTLVNELTESVKK